ncbi:isochorismate synthase, partial [Streptoalloteichus hindustanus]
PVPEPEAHLSAVARAVARMRSGEFEKVVLARSLELTVSNGDGPVDVRPLLRRLARRDPGGYTFGIDLPGERTLVGASPELLVSRSGTRVVSNPLAGSRPRSVDPVEDRRRAEELLVSAKDLHEHAVVAEFVVETLRPFCRVLEVPSGPSLVRTASMWHLSTRVSGELVDPGVSALGLACALHPTPAVCGTPTGLARAAIGELEPFDRGFYTGLLGWGDASGDGEWVVTIRCAEAVGNLLRLFAGGGIVADSVPGEELAETSAKFGTMLRALGVDQPL